MEQLILRAEPRTVVGKKVKALRREGKVPGVVYGPIVEGTVQVSVDRRAFEKFYMAHGHSTLFSLTWDGGEEQVFIREVQEDPIKRQTVHIDFFAPNLRKDLNAAIPVVIHYLSPDAVGVLTQVRNEIEVRGLPAAMPHQIEADASQLLSVGDALRVGDLKMPEGLTVVTDAEEMIALLIAQAVEEVEEVEEVEAAEEAAEAEAESAETPAEGEAESSGSES